MALKTVRYIFKPPSFWSFVMATTENQYSNICQKENPFLKVLSSTQFICGHHIVHIRNQGKGSIIPRFLTKTSNLNHRQTKMSLEFLTLIINVSLFCLMIKIIFTEMLSNFLIKNINLIICKVFKYSVYYCFLAFWELIHKFQYYNACPIS